jgi:ribonuclease HII
MSTSRLISMIKGDAQCLNVAAASILAKVSRDRYMDELDKKYPEYGFKKHKGYGTALHLEALRKYGPIEGVHRKTFRPVSDYYLKQETLF